MFEELLDRLRLDDGLGVHEFIRVLRLREGCGRFQLQTAVTSALKLGTPSRDAIELILRTQTQPEWLTAPMASSVLPIQLDGLKLGTPAPDLGVYDTLLALLAGRA